MMSISAAAAVVIFLFILRFAMPLGVVGGLCYLLNRTCDRWDAEAEEARRAQQAQQSTLQT